MQHNYFIINYKIYLYILLFWNDINFILICLPEIIFSPLYRIYYHCQKVH